MMRLTLGLAVLAVGFALATAWLIFKDDPWKATARAGEAQATLNATTGAIADSASGTITRNTMKSEAFAHEVEAAPGGDTPIPDAVRSSWLAAIDGLRESAEASDADHPPEPAY
ncbi:MAG: hypothetical protein BGN86_14510 [Caulobacterales bacterium 68-7]|nr:hypothetical protein [Caulobacterales bacterium]OJU09727.1 MAG: hypothetical protein BGN86_14510 [Caulobacterales bacterium 68-7]